MVKYTLGIILVIITGALGGLVSILGIIYAYIYCAKIKPKTR